MASFFKRMFTRKAKNSPLPKNTQSSNNKAAFRAEWEVRSKFGRGAHSRVANVLKPEEGPHNHVAKERARLEAFYKKQYASKLATITPSHKQGLIDIGKQIQEKLGSAAAAGGGSGPDTINISIPKVIAKVLLFAIGLALLALTIGAIFIDVLLSANGGGSSGGLTSLIALQSFTFMGIGRPLPSFNTELDE